MARGQLCELLWEIPNDPRGELRWCLTKLRGVLDEPHRPRVVTLGDTVSLDLRDAAVDALAVARAVQNLDAFDLDELRALAERYGGDLLEGAELDDNPIFNGWLTAQRRRFSACRAALLERVARMSPPGESLESIERWLQLAPFDRRAHEMLLQALAHGGRFAEAQAHLATSKALFEDEGLDYAPILEAWNAARRPAEVRANTDQLESAPGAHRASIAVMPFADGSTLEGRGGVCDALAHDIITRLAKLRSLFVIAQGTVFSLRDRRIGAEEAGRMLNVDYIVSGTVRRESERLTVQVELSETRTARIVWTETYDQISAMRSTFWTRSATASSLRSPARLKPPNGTAQCFCRPSRWMRGKLIIAGCGTCIASISRTTNARDRSSNWPCAWILPSRAPTQRFRSPTFRTHFKAGRPN